MNRYDFFAKILNLSSDLLFLMNIPFGINRMKDDFSMHPNRLHRYFHPLFLIHHLRTKPVLGEMLFLNSAGLPFAPRGL